MSRMSSVAVRPPGHAVLRLGRGSFLLHRRAFVVVVALAVLLAAVVVVSLSVGESFVSPVEVCRVLLGKPSPDRLVVGTLRLPRLVVGLLVGTAFGVAGALIQTVARNPLASPDVIGVTHGAGAATVAAMSFGLASHDALPYVSVGGGLAATLLVYVFAWRRGLHASRFVLVGIGISVALGSLTQLFLTKGDYLVAQQAKVWLTGSLNGRGYDQAGPLVLVLILAVPAALWAARAQRSASFDDETATALGVRLDQVRLGLAALGVVLASVATGAAGPVDFVALLAPQIARRLHPYDPDPPAVLRADRRPDRRRGGPAGPPPVRPDRAAGRRPHRRGGRAVPDVAHLPHPQPFRRHHLMSVPGTSRLTAQDLTLAYEDRTVVDGLDLEIPDGQVTVIVGPNACGKSTLLRALGRLLKPRRGVVLLDGAELARVPRKQIARTVGVLPQSPTPPDGITVADLVARGRAAAPDVVAAVVGG